MTKCWYICRQYLVSPECSFSQIFIVLVNTFACLGCRFDKIPDEIYLQHRCHDPAQHSSGKLECFSCGASSHLYQDCPQKVSRTTKNILASSMTNTIMFQLPQSLPNPINIMLPLHPPLLLLSASRLTTM